jgi:hypothetical protein
VSSRFSLLGRAFVRRIVVRWSQDGARSEPRLLEVLADEITLPLAHLIEMTDESILADRLGSQVEVLELVQLRPRSLGRGLGILSGSEALPGSRTAGVRTRRNSLAAGSRRWAGRSGRMPALPLRPGRACLGIRRGVRPGKNDRQRTRVVRCAFSERGG